MTHQVSVDHERQVVVKRYFGATRGEAAREWRALQLLAEHAPRLAPEPIVADLDGDPPSLVMSLLPGEALGGQPVTAEQQHALVLALSQLWQSVPVGVIAPVPGEVGAQAEFVRTVRGLAAEGAGPTDDRLVREALGRGGRWLTTAGLPPQGASGSRGWPAMPGVLGQGDANLTNFLWDGLLVRIVDFEDSGVSDRAFELAVLVEHVSAWWDSGLDGNRFVDAFDLSLTERAWLADWRRMAALYWLLRLRRRPDTAAVHRQAERLLSVL